MTSHRAIAPQAPSRHDAGLPEGAFVFCCFNNTHKITPGWFDVWMEILRGVEGSVLWLLDANEMVAQNLRREAEARGVAAEHIVFAPRKPLSEHLARHRLADLFLDTLPYNAHTTASDALWAGLPVLTCAGAAFAGRVAASLLDAVGLGKMITTSRDEYIAAAVRLANEPEALREIRERLAAQRLTRPLFDTARFTRHIESAYDMMWQRYKKGRPPDRICRGTVALTVVESLSRRACGRLPCRHSVVATAPRRRSASISRREPPPSCAR